LNLPGYDGWDLIGKPIGKGGQGTVYRARSPERVGELRQIKERIGELLRTNDLKDDAGLQAEFAQRIVEAGTPDRFASLGALKQFAMPADDKEEEERAIGRLASEVRALEKVNHPAVLTLLHSNVGGRFIVTEYHQRGPLHRNLNLYRGNALAALEAFRSLVDGVHEIHKQGAIHRDIKPENIFVADSGDLVLGDFGIVFFQDAGRLTTTFERVGSHFWMAPWAYDNVRLHFNEVKPALDIYPLGKVLWSMMSGQNGFPFWEYAEDDNSLEKLFPDDPSMPLVNELLAKCVVRREKDCRLSSVLDLLSEVNDLIDKIKARRGYRPDAAQTWPCRVCGKGNYQNGGLRHQVKGYRQGGPVTLQEVVLNVYLCDHCGHAELFDANKLS
jgi:serine/threonine protein kinase